MTLLGLQFLCINIRLLIRNTEHHVRSAVHTEIPYRFPPSSAIKQTYQSDCEQYQLFGKYFEQLRLICTCSTCDVTHNYLFKCRPVEYILSQCV
jgi:hypothetical protein